MESKLRRSRGAIGRGQAIPPAPSAPGGRLRRARGARTQIPGGGRRVKICDLFGVSLRRKKSSVTNGSASRDATWARRCLPPAEARHQVDGRRQKDSKPRGDMPAAARSLRCWPRARHQHAAAPLHVSAAASACCDDQHGAVVGAAARRLRKRLGDCCAASSSRSDRARRCPVCVSSLSLGARNLL